MMPRRRPRLLVWQGLVVVLAIWDAFAKIVHRRFSDGWFDVLIFVLELVVIILAVLEATAFKTQQPWMRKIEQTMIIMTVTLAVAAVALGVLLLLVINAWR